VVVSVRRRWFHEADGADIHEAFLRALDLFDDASRANGGRVCAAIHTLNGDQAAFAAFAEEHQLRVPAGRGMGPTIWTEG
jgi:hypothetical protein